MNLKSQRNLGYGLVAFGVTILTGYSLSAYGQLILFLGIVLLMLISLMFLAMKDAVNIKAGNADIEFLDAFKVTGGLYGLVFLGFIVVILLGILKGV
jgi:hypothetical protein